MRADTRKARGILSDKKFSQLKRGEQLVGEVSVPEKLDKFGKVTKYSTLQPERITLEATGLQVSLITRLRMEVIWQRMSAGDGPKVLGR